MRKMKCIINENFTIRDIWIFDDSIYYTKLSKWIERKVERSLLIPHALLNVLKNQLYKFISTLF